MGSAGLCALWPLIQSTNMYMLNSPGHLGPLSSVSLSPVCVVGGKRGKHSGVLVLAMQCRWHVRGGSPREVLVKVVDEPGRNLFPVSPEGLECKAIGSQASLVLLMGGKDCFESAKLMCFKRLLSRSVAEQAFARLSK